jgi:hypothetical protein
VLPPTCAQPSFRKLWYPGRVRKTLLNIFTS